MLDKLLPKDTALADALDVTLPVFFGIQKIGTAAPERAGESF
jgi:hypothetical protein